MSAGSRLDPAGHAQLLLAGMVPVLSDWQEDRSAESRQRYTMREGGLAAACGGSITGNLSFPLSTSLS